MLRKFVLILAPLGTVGIDVGLKPGTDLLTKGFLCRGIGKIHAISFAPGQCGQLCCACSHVALNSPRCYAAARFYRILPLLV